MCTHTLLPWAIPQWSRLGSSSQTPSPLASPLPSDAPSVSGLNNGDLVLKDISYKDDGLYQCTVANHVGYSVCVVEVKVFSLPPPSSSPSLSFSVCLSSSIFFGLARVAEKSLHRL